MISDALPPPNEKTIQLVREKLGLNEKKVKEAVQHLKDWLKRQPYLPNHYGTKHLKTYK